MSEATVGRADRDGRCGLGRPPSASRRDSWRRAAETRNARTAGRGGSLAGNSLRCKHDAESSSRLRRDGSRPWLLESREGERQLPSRRTSACAQSRASGCRGLHDRFSPSRRLTSGDRVGDLPIAPVSPDRRRSGRSSPRSKRTGRSQRGLRLGMGPHSVHLRFDPIGTCDCLLHPRDGSDGSPRCPTRAKRRRARRAPFTDVGRRPTTRGGQVSGVAGRWPPERCCGAAARRGRARVRAGL